MKTTEKTRVTKRCIPGVILIPKDGYWQVRKKGLTAKRVKQDPAFKQTRLHAKQLAQTAQAAKLITDALTPATGIKNIFQRLMPLVHKALAADTKAIPGNRHWSKADWSVLDAFEANREMPFHEAIKMHTPLLFSQDGQQAILNLPAFIPAIAIQPPVGVEHGRIFTLHACIDFELNKIETTKHRSTLIPCKPITIQPKPLIIPLNNRSGGLHIIAIGVEWYTKNNTGQLVPANIPCCLTIANAWIT